MDWEALQTHQKEYEREYALALQEMNACDYVSKEAIQALIRAAIAQIQMAKCSTGTECDYHKEKARDIVHMLENIIASQQEDEPESLPAEEPQAPAALENGQGGPEKADAPADASAWLTQESPNVSFDEIAGMYELKTALLKTISDDETDRLYGYRPPKSFLLYGPPGTGKTTASKALATRLMGEGGSFYTASCSSLLSKYHGETTKNIRALFNAVTGKEKVCLFLDEFDSICPQRGEGENQQAENQMVAELLQCVDAFNKEESSVLITATNNPWHIDSAMLSRLKKRCFVPLPDADSRAEAIRLKLEKDVDIYPQSRELREMLVIATEGYNFRDIESFCNELRGELSNQHAATGVKQSVTQDVVESVARRVKSSVQDKDLRRFEQWEAQA